MQARMAEPDDEGILLNFIVLGAGTAPSPGLADSSVTYAQTIPLGSPIPQPGDRLEVAWMADNPTDMVPSTMVYRVTRRDFTYKLTGSSFHPVVRLFVQVVT
jgi:hypothetical protein